MQNLKPRTLQQLKLLTTANQISREEFWPDLAETIQSSADRSLRAIHQQVGAILTWVEGVHLRGFIKLETLASVAWSCEVLGQGCETSRPVESEANLSS